MRLALVAVLILAGCDPVSHGPVDKTVTKDVVDLTEVSQPDAREVLLVGDSEACAVGPLAKRREGPTLRVSVDCKVSSTIPYWSDRIKDTLAQHPHPSTVVVFLGTNHYWVDKDLPDVSPVVDPIIASGAKCVWVGNVAVKGRRWPVNRLLRDAVGSRCTYFDTEAAGIELADGVHPTQSGAVKWMGSVWQLVD